jgi:hypothetical protein
MAVSCLSESWSFRKAHVEIGAIVSIDDEAPHAFDFDDHPQAHEGQASGLRDPLHAVFFPQGVLYSFEVSD